MATGRAACAAIAATVGLVLMPTSAPAAGAMPAADDGVAAVLAGYETRIPELMAQQHISGLAVALVDGDRVVWQRGFGSTDDHGGRPVTVDTLFSAQSTSKVFTATAVMQAVQAGLLDLDVPITTYVPHFTVHSVFEPHPERLITLRMLLGHTAGFTHEAPLGNNFDPDPGDFDAHVASISQTWLRFPVGTGYAYSNLGIDLAGYILEQVSNKPFPNAVRDSLLAPLGMTRSTFDRSQVHSTTDRAVGHADAFAAQPIDIPMTAAGGLWTTAADLAKFLRFQLTDGVVGGRALLKPALMKEMRSVPAPMAGAPAGYALGVARTHWRVGHYADLFSHGGGGFGFLSDLYWLPQLQLGIAVLTNSDTHNLQSTLALGILSDLVNDSRSEYHPRLVVLPPQSDVVEPDENYVAPVDMSARIAAVALPASRQQAQRWERYTGWYRTGRLGSIDPSDPPSRFHVDSGVPYFDAGEDGTSVRHRLTEVQPGLFLAENGETLDLRGDALRWRGMHLNSVTNGPLAAQWVLLAAVTVVAVGWLLTRSVNWVRRRRRTLDRWPGGRTGRRLTAAVGAVAALATLVAVTAIVALPALVDVGFLGALAAPLPLRLAFHLPLAVALLAGGLGALLVVGGVRHWWGRRIRAGDGVLAVAVGALALQLASWHVIGWGF